MTGRTITAADGTEFTKRDKKRGDRSMNGGEILHFYRGADGTEAWVERRTNGDVYECWYDANGRGQMKEYQHEGRKPASAIGAGKSAEHVAKESIEEYLRDDYAG